MTLKANVAPIFHAVAGVASGYAGYRTLNNVHQSARDCVSRFGHRGYLVSKAYKRNEQVCQVALLSLAGSTYSCVEALFAPKPSRFVNAAAVLGLAGTNLSWLASSILKGQHRFRFGGS